MTNPKHINPGLDVTVSPPGCVIDDSYREREQSKTSQKCAHYDVCLVVHKYGKCGSDCDYDTTKLRVPKEQECFGVAYLESDDACQICRASEQCREILLSRKEHDKQVRKEERERVLDEIEKICKKYGGYILELELAKKIESLRKEQQQ